MKLTRLAGLLACAGLFAAGHASAQTYPQIPGPDGSNVSPQPTLNLPQSGVQTSAVTALGTSPSLVDAAVTHRSYILLHNPAPLGGATVSCAWGATAVLNGGGTVTIYPGQYLTYENNAAPNTALSCVASAASTPFTAQLLDQ